MPAKRGILSITLVCMCKQVCDHHIKAIELGNIQSLPRPKDFAHLGHESQQMLRFVHWVLVEVSECVSAAAICLVVVVALLVIVRALVIFTARIIHRVSFHVIMNC